MDEKKTTFGLNADKIVRFLKMGMEDELAKPECENDTNLSRANLLRDLLKDVLPAEAEAIKGTSVLLRYFYREFLPLAGYSLGDLLNCPATDISVIKQIKNHAKELSAKGDSEIACETATTLYYGAIASALLFHNRKITQYSFGELNQSFSTISEQEWMSPIISQLIVRARQLCRTKMGDDTERQPNES